MALSQHTFGPVEEQAVDPTVDDDASAGFDVGTVWINTATDEVFISADVSVGAAVWVGPLAAADHAAITLAVDADVLLGLAGQELNLDSQDANLVFAGPAAGGAADPTFRSLVDADIPAAIARDAELHAEAHAAAQHNAAVLPALANENLGAFYLDINGIAVPANPGAGVRRLFVDTATGEISVRTSAGATVSLEAPGGVTDHGALTGLLDDDHTIYALLAGRAGGQILIGGTAASEDLILQSTSHATRGEVTVEDHSFIHSGDELIHRWDTGDEQSFDTVLNRYVVRIAGVDGIVATPTVLEINAVPVEIQQPLTLIADDITFTAIGGPRFIEVISTITLDFVNTTMQVLNFRPEIIIEQEGNPFGMGALFNSNPLFPNSAAEANNFGPILGFISQPRYQADSQTIALSVHRDFISQPRFRRINGGVLNVTEWTSFLAGDVGEVDTACTVTTRRAFWVRDVLVNGTLTTQIGLDIDALSNADTNIGIRNASPTVYTPQEQVVTAGATIRSDATIVEISSAGAVTMTSTPTIADGQDGQKLIIINIDPFDTITLQDETVLAGSSLRLAGGANLALGPRDAVGLVFSVSLGDWIRVDGSNN